MTATAHQTRDEIYTELDRIYSQLSPENLTWDGERPKNEIVAAARSLKARQQALYAELKALDQ